MFFYHHLWLLFIFSAGVYTQTTDKYTDENRPYKFGFNIEGYQHRQEQKDEKGIIKGEYGFITADGYYRVTVYATDENGDFRIISMKNYYVGFPPEDPTTTPGAPAARQGGAGLKPANAVGAGRTEERGKGVTGSTGSLGSSAPREPKKIQGISACSDCYIPTTTTTTKPLFGFTSGGDGKGAREGGRALGQDQGQREKFPGPINLNSIPNASPPRSNFEREKTSQLQSGPGGGQFPGSFGDPHSAGAPGASGIPGTPRAPGSQPFAGNDLQNPNIPATGLFGSDRGGQPRGQIDALQNNGLDNSPNRRPHIGEVRDGLPPGVPLSAIKDLLLYRFNYTVGFHGHHEDGYRNGDKEGDYFFDGRDGVERKVEYIANEFGYQPNITLIDLQENDVRRPKEETEKEYGLKGYEFKWFYRK